MAFRRTTSSQTVGAVAAWLVGTVIVTYGTANAFRAALDPITAATIVASSLAAISLMTTGAVLVTRLPRNPIGWLLFASGLLSGFAFTGSAPLPFSPAVGSWVAWLANLCWVPALVAIGILLPLLFPTGKLPSPRWRPVVAIAVLATALSDLNTAFTPFSSNSAPPDIHNPLAVSGWAVTVLGIADTASTACGVIFFPLVAASLVLRYRTAQGSERAQLRWLVAALALIGPSLAVGIATSSVTSGWLVVVSSIAWLAVTVGLVLLPVAIGIAVLRYRLYDIDVLLNRTVVYATVSLALAAIFVAANLVLQQIVQAVSHQQSAPLTIGLAFSAGLLFNPLRRRLRPVVDRLLPPRAMQALLFTDIVGSTEMIVQVGDQRWRAVLARYLAVVRAELGRHGGQEVNTAGDAFFATFHRPLDALRAAWAIRAAVRKLGLETRTGLHLGEVEMRGEQVSGLAVHTAARIMAAAGDGEILISDPLREAIDGPGIGTSRRGRHDLKGVPGDWQLYAVETAG